jgi:2-polyprenyl-3-methyl-5-hydroxy-6-metoxy-1,4-benzoquinol methylase
MTPNVTNNNSIVKGFDTTEHKELFDIWNTYSDIKFRFCWGAFLENKFLLDAISTERSSTILDVGCATGTTVRWLKIHGLFDPSKYLGIDLGGSIIDRAKELYPDSKFEKVRPNAIHNMSDKYQIVFSRDTIPHQTDPFTFIGALLNCCSKTLIVRLRTRDKGVTVLDENLSCQSYAKKFWMPYIVLNIDELVEYFTSHPFVSSIKISRSYEILGGEHGRYLPKELYFSEAGGAETIVKVQLSNSSSSNAPSVKFQDVIEGHTFIHNHKRKLRYIQLLDFMRNIFGKRH